MSGSLKLSTTDMGNAMDQSFLFPGKPLLRAECVTSAAPAAETYSMYIQQAQHTAGPGYTGGPAQQTGHTAGPGYTGGPAQQARHTAGPG